jgi:hypothetical protein
LQKGGVITGLPKEEEEIVWSEDRMKTREKQE